MQAIIFGIITNKKFDMIVMGFIGLNMVRICVCVFSFRPSSINRVIFPYLYRCIYLYLSTNKYIYLFNYLQLSTGVHDVRPLQAVGWGHLRPRQSKSRLHCHLHLWDVHEGGIFAGVIYLPPSFLLFVTETGRSSSSIYCIEKFRSILLFLIWISNQYHLSSINILVYLTLSIAKIAHLSPVSTCVFALCKSYYTA